MLMYADPKSALLSVEESWGKGFGMKEQYLQFQLKLLSFVCQSLPWDVLWKGALTLRPKIAVASLDLATARR